MDNGLELNTYLGYVVIMDLWSLCRRVTQGDGFFATWGESAGPISLDF